MNVLENKKPIVKLILDGEKLVFWKQYSNEEELQLVDSDGVYWKDAENPQGFGPFQYISDCLEHYTFMQKLKKKIVIKETPDDVVLPIGNQPVGGSAFVDNVIHVDFINKRRM